MKCNICKKEYQTYPEAKACYDSHPQTEAPQQEKQTSPLDELNNLYKKKTEPVKRIQPKNILEGETAPITIARKILELAKDNSDFNGVGRINLAEARFALSDSSIKMEDLVELLRREAPTLRIEPAPGRMIQIYFNNKIAKSDIHPVDRHEETLKRLTNAKFTGL